MWKVAGAVHGIDQQPEPMVLSMRSLATTWAYRARATATAAVP